MSRFSTIHSTPRLFFCFLLTESCNWFYCAVFILCRENVSRSEWRNGKRMSESKKLICFNISLTCHYSLPPIVSIIDKVTFKKLFVSQKLNFYNVSFYFKSHQIHAVYYRWKTVALKYLSSEKSNKL